MEEQEALTLEMRGVGTFVLKRASMMDQLRIGKRRRALLQDLDADMLDVNFAHIMASIDTLSETKPENFSWERIYDLNAVTDMWGEYREWEQSLLDTKSNSEA